MLHDAEQEVLGFRTKKVTQNSPIIYQYSKCYIIDSNKQTNKQNSIFITKGLNYTDRKLKIHMHPANFLISRSQSSRCVSPNCVNYLYQPNSYFSVVTTLNAT